MEVTEDPHWPSEVNNPHYAPLITERLEAVIRAHRNLRATDHTRFTDQDLRTILAFARLGIPESAFKQLGAADYWKIGFIGHEAFEELDALAPEATAPIRHALRTAPPPYCWLGSRDGLIVTRALYLSAILLEHGLDRRLLLANLDPVLISCAEISDDVLRDHVPGLMQLDPAQADRDLCAAEEHLPTESLQLLLVDQMKLTEPEGWCAALERERYSTLIRCVALSAALEDALSVRPRAAEHARVNAALSQAMNETRFVDRRPSPAWERIREAYRLAGELRPELQQLSAAVREAQVRRPDQLSFAFYWKAWNEGRINRLEYHLSALARLLETAELLPRPADEMPAHFRDLPGRLVERVRKVTDEAHRGLDELNGRFQDLVAREYSAWAAGDTDVRLTAQFLRRCLKPHWDPETEKAVVLIFDGMRYDIWDELLRPLLVERMTVLEDYPAISILPSETQLTRKAISAGAFPEAFDSHQGEDRLLRDGLARVLGLPVGVKAVAPEGSGTGEAVRYRAGNLEVFIFELCDKELHKIGWRTLPDGREAPTRPLAFLYDIHIRNLLEIEVLAVVRGLAPGTKVFVTADHGFGPVGRERIWFEDRLLNEPGDCSYQNCWLKDYADLASLPRPVQENILAFTPRQLRVFEHETISPRGHTPFRKNYGAVVFPRVGHAFSRNGVPFRPDAYSHGGISLQELLIPMIVLRVDPREDGPLALGSLEGPDELPEGAEAEFRLRLTRPAGADGDLRVELAAAYSENPDCPTLPSQVLYVPSQGTEAVLRFLPDSGAASPDERRQGAMVRTLTVSILCREGGRTLRRTATRRFTVRLQPDQMVRRMGNLGNILGLAPKSMR